MKLLMYIFKEEYIFDSNDKYSLNITKSKIEHLKKSPAVYENEHNRYAISLLEDMLKEEYLPIPGEYFKLNKPYLYMVEKDNGSIQAFTEKGLIDYMKAYNVDKICYDREMCVKLNGEDELDVYGLDRSLTSSGLSDFIYRHTEEKKDYKVYTGIELRLSSGNVKIYGKASGYVLEMQGKYTNIMNTLINRDKEYVTKIYYNFPINQKYNIVASEHAIFILDRIKDDVYRKDREAFGNLYSKAKSNLPIEAEYELDNFIYAVTLCKNGIERTITSKESALSSYNDKDGKMCILKVGNNFTLENNYPIKDIEVDFRLEPTGYKDEVLLSKESFRVKVTERKGIVCRVSGSCQVPSSYKDKLHE